MTRPYLSLRRFQTISLAYILLTLLACDPAKRVTSQDSNDGKIDFILLQINDVYEIAPLEGGKVGGMARLATLYRQLKKSNPNTLFVHAGDFLYPSLIGTMKYEGSRIKGRQMVEMMNRIGVDLVVFGNHEFDLDADELQQRLNESSFEWLGTNVRQVNEQGHSSRFAKIVNKERVPVHDSFLWQIKDEDGTALSISFFGATINSNPKDYVKYLNFHKTSRMEVDRMQKAADLVLGLTHLSLEQDKELAAKITNVPLIMGGHEHHNMLHKVGNTQIAKADANAKTAYIHYISYDKNTKKANIDSRLIPVDESIAIDKEVAKGVEKWMNIAYESFRKNGFDPDEIITKASVPLDGRETTNRYGQTNLGALLTKSMMQSSRHNAEAAIVNSGSIRLDDQLYGNITQFDIIRTIPYGGPVHDVEMTGSLLKAVLDEGESKKGEGAYLQRAYIKLDPTRKNWLINGQPIEQERVYRIIIGDYLLLGYDIKVLKEGVEGLNKVNKPNKNDKSDRRNDIRQAVIHYLKTHH